MSLTISWGEINPNEIRQLICDYIEQSKEFLLVWRKSIWYCKYTRNIRKDIVSGEEIEIDECSQIFNVNIFINTLGLTKKVEFNHPKYTETISFFLNIKFRHFDFLLPKLSSLKI